MDNIDTKDKFTTKESNNLIHTMSCTIMPMAEILA